jgi:putative transposase
MGQPRYIWRQLTPEQREEVLAWRKANARPWHSPPHRPNRGHRDFLVSAACFEHAHHIGFCPQRMDDFAASLLDVLDREATRTIAWCVLPNHYHALVEAPNILKLLGELGQLHGRTSHRWNGEERTRGRQVFHRATERFMRSDRHFFASLNYVHNNPVHHRYVQRWTDWPWSSAIEYLERTGRAEAERLWKEFPLLDYGKKWDQPEL